MQSVLRSGRALTLCAGAMVLGWSHCTGIDIEHKNAVPGETYNYGQALYLSLLFYEAQRSGKLPSNNRVPWRADSAMQDGSDVGLDLTGGWYDAGDHVKFSLTMAWSVTVLSWGLIEYEDSWHKTGELDNALDAIKWPLDFMLKAHPDPNTFYVQVGDGAADHAYWGSAEMMHMKRPSVAVTADEPGTEPVAQAAAAMAAGSIVFKDRNSVYATELLTHAKSLFELAKQHQATCHLSDPFYTSYSGFRDELAWSAAWLYKATGERDYLDFASSTFTDCCTNPDGGFSWDSQASGASLLLYILTSDERYRAAFESYMDNWMSMRKTPKGLAFFDQWGPNRYASNTAFLSLVAADYGISPTEYRDFGMSQIHYILGDAGGGINPQTKQPFFSYLIGYGQKYPRSPHHRGASCEGSNCSCGDQPDAHILYGAVVGGPGVQDDYRDTCNDYIHNEVAIDYNAGFTSAVAALKHLSITGQLPS